MVMHISLPITFEGLISKTPAATSLYSNDAQIWLVGWLKIFSKISGVKFIWKNEGSPNLLRKNKRVSNFWAFLRKNSGLVLPIKNDCPLRLSLHGPDFLPNDSSFQDSSKYEVQPYEISAEVISYYTPYEDEEDEKRRLQLIVLDAPIWERQVTMAFLISPLPPCYTLSYISWPSSPRPCHSLKSNNPLKWKRTNFCVSTRWLLEVKMIQKQKSVSGFMESRYIVPHSELKM